MQTADIVEGDDGDQTSLVQTLQLGVDNQQAQVGAQGVEQSLVSNQLLQSGVVAVGLGQEGDGGSCVVQGGVTGTAAFGVYL